MVVDAYPCVFFEVVSKVIVTFDVNHILPKCRVLLEGAKVCTTWELAFSGFECGLVGGGS